MQVLTVRSHPLQFLVCQSLCAMVLMNVAVSRVLAAQTAATGALVGTTLDPSGAMLPGATVLLQTKGGKEAKSTISDESGRFAFLLLPPGSYTLQANKSNFAPLSFPEIQVFVTETVRVELHFALETLVERAQVSSTAFLIQLDTSALGRVVSDNSISGLPLVTRNFTQIAELSPGIAVGVYNAGELGIGATAQSQINTSNDGIYVHGARSYDNNWQLDGISVSDILSSGSASGGIPTPNPDTLQEFKVQSGLYDAEFGTAVGANVSVITKPGTNSFHGTLFEFLRNDVLNANDFFLNKTGQQRPELKQNQFGFTVGGPARKDKIFFFGSYQGTRQINGIAAGQARIACTVTLSEPPITNHRSAKALGALFGGMQGALGGIAVAPDGSNINPVALALLNFKLPNGSFLIPTPQKVDTSRPFAQSGFSAFTQPCDFGEDQALMNVDDNLSPKNRLAAHFFVADDHQTVSFPGSGLNPSGNIRGFGSPGGSQFLVFSLAHTYFLSGNSVNDAKVGFVRTSANTAARAPFTWSDAGVSAGSMNENNELPSLNILGSISMASAFPRSYPQDSFALNDILSVLRGPHSLKMGGSLTRSEDNLDFAGTGAALRFLSWPDFLLGLSAKQNGASFSNVSGSSDFFGLLNREFRAWEGSAFVQDDYCLRRSLTLNLGLRYERLGQFADKLGRNSSFDFNRANSRPPAQGSLDGYIVAANFPDIVPAGVVRTNNTLGNYGEGQNALAPRVGFAWKVLPRSSRLALRGAYGIYYSRITGQAYTQSVSAFPFAISEFNSGLGNAAATFQNPFNEPFPTTSSFPRFVPYSPMTYLTVNALAPDIRPAMVQQFSLNVQAEVLHGWLLETGYVGARGTHLQRFRSLNQALDASPANPVREVKSNTLANIGLRVPIPGIPADSLRELESEGGSWYNGLEASLAKNLSHGLQFLASYTFSKTLDTDGAVIDGTSAGNTLTLGDQNSARQRRGRASFDRTHRFTFSTTWSIVSPAGGLRRAIFGGWSLSAIATIQAGSALTIADTNSKNVFGISEDRAQLTGVCSRSQLVRGGLVESKLNSYFNGSCFSTPPIIGADGMGTGFGDSATGIVDGPGQANLDLALLKAVPVKWPLETASLQFRAEFYNALNHPQFSNPDNNFTSPTFGVISSTAVSPRVGQLALRFAF